MKLPMDYHVHTRFSPDSWAEPVELCRQAVEVGIEEICFTDHFDLNPRSLAEYSLDPAEYLAEIGRCRELFAGRLVVRAGLELGEPHLYEAGLTEILAKYQFDYLLGSIHWLGEDLIGPEYLAKKEFCQACREYLELVLKTAKSGHFHCIGHLDMVKRHSTDYYKRAFHYADFREEVDCILRQLVEAGRGLEVNTSGWRQGVKEPYPGLEVLKSYRALGGEIITLGSDTHRVPALGNGLAEGLALVKAAGFKALARFEAGMPSFIDI